MRCCFGKRLCHLVSGFTHMTERIATIRIRAKLYNISLFCAHDCDVIVSCMSYSTTWTLCNLLISSNCAGSAMSFVWKRMLRRDGYLMRGSTEVGEEDDLVSVGRTKSRKPCHRLVCPTGVGAQEAEAPGRKFYGRPKSVNRVVMAI